MESHGILLAWRGNKVGFYNRMIDQLSQRGLNTKPFEKLRNKVIEQDLWPRIPAILQVVVPMITLFGSLGVPLRRICEGLIQGQIPVAQGCNEILIYTANAIVVTAAVFFFCHFCLKISRRRQYRQLAAFFSEQAASTFTSESIDFPAVIRYKTRVDE